MSYVKVSENGDFIFCANDNVLLVFGNRILEYPMYYRIAISHSVFLSPRYSSLVKDFFTEYFSVNALFELARCIKRARKKQLYYDWDFTAVLLNPFWKRMKTYTVNKALKIIDDALCHNFEFKVENGDVYFRETMNSL